MLEACGDGVLVATSCKVRLISRNDKKQDDMDAQWLARWDRPDLPTLAPTSTVRLVFDVT